MWNKIDRCRVSKIKVGMIILTAHMARIMGHFLKEGVITQRPKPLFAPDLKTEGGSVFFPRISRSKSAKFAD